MAVRWRHSCSQPANRQRTMAHKRNCNRCKTCTLIRLSLFIPQPQPTRSPSKRLVDCVTTVTGKAQFGVHMTHVQGTYNDEHHQCTLRHKRHRTTRRNTAIWLTNTGTISAPQYNLTIWNSSRVFGAGTGLSPTGWYSGFVNASAATAFEFNGALSLQQEHGASELRSRRSSTYCSRRQNALNTRRLRRTPWRLQCLSKS